MLDEANILGLKYWLHERQCIAFPLVSVIIVVVKDTGEARRASLRSRCRLLPAFTDQLERNKALMNKQLRAMRSVGLSIA